LGTKEREKYVYGLAKRRKRKENDLDQVNCIKVESGENFVREKDMKDRRKKYFRKLFNEAYEISLNSNMLDTI